jgi:hypothetical protein
MSKGSNTTGESDHRIYTEIHRFQPYFWRLMGNEWDGDDLGANLVIKFIEKSRKEPDFLEGIENERPINQTKKLSDEWASYSRVEKNLDYKPYKKLMRELLKEFPPYQRTLLQLNLFEGCKPYHIIEILINEYPNLLKSEFPEYSNLSKKELKEKMEMFVPRDCNSAAASYRLKLKKSVKKVK